MQCCVTVDAGGGGDDVDNVDDDYDVDDVVDDYDVDYDGDDDDVP